MQKFLAGVLVAVLSPVIVVMVLLCSLGTGAAQHNVSAVQLCFDGGVIPASFPAEYRAHIEEMRSSFALLDAAVDELNGQMEDGQSLDDVRVKAIFYALFFGEEAPSRRDCLQFADCFVDYDNAEHWRTLLTSQATELAKAMKIPQSEFRWYAAFHDKEDHPHVHMVCYSADGRSGFLTEHGIETIKSMLAREIFQQDLTEIYQRQTQHRDDLTRDSAELMRQLVSEMQSGTLEHERIGELMLELARRLKNLSRKSSTAI